MSELADRVSTAIAAVGGIALPYPLERGTTTRSRGRPYTSGSCSTLTMEGGATIQDLNTYSFNNYTSSIKVCPAGLTFTECQSY